MSLRPFVSTRKPGRGERTLVSAWAILLAWLVPLVLPAATFTASLGRNPITLGETATLSLTFNGGTPEQDLQLPAVPNLQFTWVGRSQQYTVVNGQLSSSVTYNYTVVPQQAGEYTIPAISVIVGGQHLTTQPLKLTVLRRGAPPPRVAASTTDPAFLRLVLPKKTVYVGETVVGELQLFLSSKVHNPANFRVASVPADGVTTRTPRVAGQARRVQVGNAVYTEIPFEIAFTPVKIGSLSIGPVSASVDVQIPSNRRDSFFDGPFGFWGAVVQKTVPLTSGTEKLHVVSLPTKGAPANFNGAVGNYAMRVAAGPTNVAVGDPITVKIQIAGRGALDSLVLPSQPAWHDFKIYPSPPKVQNSDSLGIQGVKTFEEVLVPQNADIKALPPVSFTFFDVDRQSYRTLTGPEIALDVRPGGAQAVPVVAAGSRGNQRNPPAAEDVVAIKQHLGEVAQIAPPLVERGWFLSLQGVPALALLGTVIWRKRRERYLNNPRLRRRRRVAHLVREGRNDLRRFAAENNSDEFFGAVFRLLQEQLGAQLDLPASAITEAVIEERLRPQGVAESTLAGLHELFQACNLARYAPIRTSQELAAFIPGIETVLDELQEENA